MGGAEIGSISGGGRSRGRFAGQRPSASRRIGLAVSVAPSKRLAQMADGASQERASANLLSRPAEIRQQGLRAAGAPSLLPLALAYAECGDACDGTLRIGLTTRSCAGL